MQLNIKKPIKKWADNLNRHSFKDIYQMFHRHIKRCSPSLIIREMKIKITVRNHLVPVRMTIIKKTGTKKYWQGLEEKEPYGKQYGSSSKNRTFI